MRLFLFLGIVLAAHAQDTTPSANPSLSSVPSSQPSLDPSGSPSTSFLPSKQPSWVPSVKPSSSHEPSLSLAPSEGPTKSQVPSVVPTDVPSQDPTVSFQPSLSAQPSSDPTVSMNPSASFAPSTEPTMMDAHRGLKIEIEVNTPSVPIAPGAYAAVNAKIWKGRCSIFDYTKGDVELEEIKFVLLDDERQDKENFFDKPKAELNGKHKVTMMLDIRKETIMDSKYFCWTDEYKTKGLFSMCFRTFVSLDEPGDAGAGVIDAHGMELRAQDKVEVQLELDLTKGFIPGGAANIEVNRGGAVTGSLTQFDKEFGENVIVVATRCDANGVTSTFEPLTIEQDVFICLEISNKNFGISDIQRMTFSQVGIGEWSPIDGFASRLTTQKGTLDESTDKKWLAKTRLPIPFFRNTKRSVSVSGSILIKFQNDDELRRTASGRITLESGEMRKLQETESSGYMIGSFSLDLDIEPLDDGSATPEDTSSQTTPGGVDVEDMSNTATYSVSALALLVVGVTIINIML
mmetsp:Transcript_58173/g.86479  ORF Transcript_58173/g.86479 Transcript_58173/m.86479 type:complete len:518 (-) Transcript_58173:174-1727(-)